MPIETRSTENPDPRPGPFLAKVISHLDPSYMGGLEVELLRPVGNNEAADGQLHQVKYMSPFAGQTGVTYNNEDPDNYNNTQKSYGMWMIPPDVGATVMVIFIDGDPRKGYWIGCVPDENVNFSVPGLAATKYVVNDTKTLTSYERLPVAEYNKTVDKAESDPTKITKPEHPFAKVLDKQGLAEDDIRGITTSSARRETPSMVFGISTPGPVDKQEGANKGDIGKADSRIPGAFVSRLGGTTFVMDDGDDKFLRKKPAGEGPPEYASVEQGETDGDRTIPHNELVRIRTRTGHQILLHNSEDLIYIGNAKGTTWIELTSNGKIDIFAEDSISIHTKNDLNVTADRDINLTAARDINLSAGRDTKITSAGVSHINSTTAHRETAGRIDMNGTVATKASKPVRIPQHEPWAGHENLDPTAVTPAKTEAALTAPASASPAKFKKYTTPTDTFEKLRRPGKESTE